MELQVNGKTHQVEAPEDMPLLWVLRDLLDIKGPKFGCGVGACGACTVLVDGIPTRTCRWPVHRRTRSDPEPRSGSGGNRV